MASTTQPSATRKLIRVRGIVQGVGFRPFVYNLAHVLGLTGYVLNSSAGVTIEIEGEDARVREFLEVLRHKPPPLAQIEEFSVADLQPLGDAAFVIRHSRAEAGEFVLVSPDVATCDDCWREFGDPANRRYGYPFTNCTNCGPRYTIIRDIPYDRPMTTMASFRMCGLCQAEYEDPIEVSEHIRRQEDLERVCLSGGTFQNMYLLEGAVTGLREKAFEVYLHSVVPPNDGGISLGQAVIANEILRKA